MEIVDCRSKIEMKKAQRGSICSRHLALVKRLPWSLSKNYSLDPHLVTPSIFSLSPDEEPSSHAEVERHPHRQEWILGEIKERDSVFGAKCLKIINRSEVPPDRKILRLRWVYKIKRNDKGDAVLYKCRIVVMGNHATQGIDYFETYSPASKIPSLRLVIAFIIHFGLKPCQVDVHTAYLHADLDEDIYVSEMPGYQLPPGKVYKLLKSLCGLPQAGKNWNDLLDAFLKSLGLLSQETQKYTREASVAYNWYEIIFILSTRHQMYMKMKRRLSSLFTEVSVVRVVVMTVHRSSIVYLFGRCVASSSCTSGVTSKE